jgi:hypothetical protein
MVIGNVKDEINRSSPPSHCTGKRLRAAVLFYRSLQTIFGSSSNLVVISFLFQLSSSFLILLKVVDMFAF